MKRRDFFKVTVAGSAAATLTGPAFCRDKQGLPDDALGLLYDATLCIGCKACEVACKRVNNLPQEHGTDLEAAFGVNGTWDSGPDVNSRCYNKIKVYTDGSAEVKDREKDGYSFIKKSCRHCVDPACVSACPATALTKNAKDGIVSWNADACIGCRYCQIACPFNIPKFEYDKAFPRIQKCGLCKHLIAKDGIPGCADFCPTGATIFGKTADLLAESNRRLNMVEGTSASFPVRKLNSSEQQIHPVESYVKDVYGDKEGGGTQVLTLAGVPFKKLGLPALPDYATAQKSETLQHTIYKGLIAPIVLLGGLVTAAFKNTDGDEGGDDES